MNDETLDRPRCEAGGGRSSRQEVNSALAAVKPICRAWDHFLVRQSSIAGRLCRSSDHGDDRLSREVPAIPEILSSPNPTPKTGGVHRKHQVRGRDPSQTPHGDLSQGLASSTELGAGCVIFISKALRPWLTGRRFLCVASPMPAFTEPLFCDSCCTLPLRSTSR